MLLLLVLTLALVLALLSCTKQEEKIQDDDSWMQGDVGEYDSNYAHAQEDDGSDSAAQSNKRITTPIAPWD